MASATIVGPVDAGHPDFDAVHALLVAAQTAGGIQVDKAEGGIVFEHAGLENTDDLAGSDFRQHAHGRQRPFRGNQADFAPRSHVQLPGQFQADDDGRQLARQVKVSQLPALHLPADIDDPAGGGGFDTAQHDAA
jgi:hypothetical protein